MIVRHDCGAVPRSAGSGGVSLAERLRDATPAFLFGLRLWASVCVAFYVAFALELSEPSWAATTAALVCQPVLGASLRKSMFRMIGTVVGADRDRRPRRALSPGSGGLSRRTCALVRGLRLRRDAIAQFRRLRRGARRLHGGDHRDRRSRAGRKHERHRLHVRHRSRARDLHRHRLRRRRARLDRSRALATKARNGIRGICRARSWMGLRIAFATASSQPRPVSRASTRTPAARHRALSDDRRGDRRGVRPALSFGGAAAGGRRASWRRSRPGARLRLRSRSTATATTPREANAVHDLLPQARLSPNAIAFDRGARGVARRVLRRRCDR